MVGYKEAGVELVQARGKEGRFTYDGEMLRLGPFAEGDSWYVGVHRSSGGLLARLSLESAKSLKEATDMLKYGFFLQREENEPLIKHLASIGLLAISS